MYTLLLSFLTAAVAAAPEPHYLKWAGQEYIGQVKHVAIFSFDGMHASDLDKYIALVPGSNFSKLLETGYRYTNAYTSFPSDSFPGTLAPFTGSSPRTHGVWYDDTWDRTYYAPGSNCTGTPGADVVYDETIDLNSTLLFSGIDPNKLPRAIIGGKCSPVYPHSRPRVNTIFEVVAQSGKKTAYTDKHYAYDLVRGPSGAGLSLGYFPEINSVGDFTANVTQCIKYDTLHLNAFLTWLDGKDPANAEGSLGGVVPTLFGGNFQSVSVGQKTSGYVNKTLAFTTELRKAFDFVDMALGAVVNKLQANKLYEETLIIVASKHGQSPIDPANLVKIDPAIFTKELAVNTSHITYDDVALIFLKDQKDLNTAVKNLQAHATDLRIADIVYGSRQINLGLGDASKDPAVPDIIVQPTPGTIYTTSKTKLAEHGGGSIDDRLVTTFVSNPRLQKRVYSGRVDTKNVAPVVLKALGLSPSLLKGVVAEGTRALDGF